MVVRRATNVFGLFGSSKKLVYAVIKRKNVGKVVQNIAKKQGLRMLGSVNYVRTFYNYGFNEATKRYLINRVPMEFRKVGWFINSFKKDFKTRKFYRQFKEDFWKKSEWGNITNKEKAEKLDKLVRMRPREKEYKEIKNEVLNKTFWFYVKSPQTQSFSQMPQYANITKKTYGVPIKSQLFNQLQYYQWNNLGGIHWTIVKEAMTTNDYGREVYPFIRSEPLPQIKILLKELIYNN